MPVPTAITDLSTTESSNAPAGTDSAKGVVDNFFRAHAKFIRQNYDAIQLKAASADLAASTGATLVKYLPAFTGATAKTLQTKAKESISILEAGGVDDWNGTTGTNNFAAFEALCALAPITIRLPRTSTGIYMLSGTTALTTTAGVILDADEGVSLHIQGSGRAPVGIAGIKSTRYLDVYHQTLRYSQPLGPQMFVKPSEKSGFMSGNAGELHKPIAIDFTTDAYSAKLSSWPNGTLGRYTPTTTLAASVVHPTPGAIFAGTLVNVVPGDQIYAQISTSANLPSILIETELGWKVIWSTIGAAGVSEMEFVAGEGVTASSNHPILVNSAYNLDKAMVGIHIYDEKSFGLLVNGVLIKRYSTAYNIVAAGWSGGFGASPFSIDNPVMFKNKRTTGVKPLKIVCVGDSISARTTTLKSHFEFAAQYLTGMGGFQLDTLTNLAVAGDTSTNQLADLLATTITDYDYCLIQIGVNDIQTAAAVATFTANVESMITYCRTNNVTPIVGLPTMWYSQTSAQVFSQDGAATDNSNATGMTYRLALMRKLADLGVYCNAMVLEDEGAVIASLLALSGADQIVADNIHPTVYGSMLMGYSWAKSLAAHITSAPTDVVTATEMDRPWFSAPVNPDTVPFYTVNNGTLNTTGYLSKGAATWANGDVIGTLPKRLRPASPVIQQFQCFDAGVSPLAGSGCLIINEAGVMTIYNIAVSTAFIAVTANWRI